MRAPGVRTAIIAVLVVAVATLVSPPSATAQTGAATRHQVWSIRTPDPCCEAPQTTNVVAADGTAYFAGAAGDVHAVDVTTGAPTWRRQAPECAVAQAGPALHDGLLLVPTQACTPDDFNSWLTAYDASTGRAMWSHRAINDMSTPVTWAGLAFVVSTSAAGFGHYRLDAIDLRTGASRWHLALGTQASVLATDDTTLYLSTATTLTALDPSTGGQRWSRAAPGGHVIVRAGHVVVAGAAGGGQVVTSYSPTGHRQWRASLSGPAELHLAGTTSEVVVADARGTVDALQLADGSFAWISVFSTAVTSTPAIAGGVVYLTLATPTSSAVYAVRDGTGGILWHFTEPAGDASVTASPSVAAGTLFVSLGSGVLRAFRS